ncbi:FAD-binding oxidoreductase [Marinactinospora thermotolerans]|uniref:FAD/FMN-containing dehydrogenase n=1 Tax=Marinactinospora thermotolerans DSM 45154 TaxID=1122192 RepID=A0A1T4R8X0_9ACTN|nr:FAD-binding oxidoreductase [Marinactinospora thermotolerans]SKA12520.1 FAD/FMN-containing dehydrogenase [Marinactinospora thermotolerans DSM 45154]
MNGISRRGLLTWSALTGSAVASGALVTPGLATASTAPDHSRTSPITTVGPSDPRYPALTRGQNQRWVSTPEQVHIPRTTKEVVTAVSKAVSSGKKISVRSGGHCYENFVDRPDVQVIIDMSQMTAIDWDSAKSAISVEAGAPLGDVYYTLFKRWGITLPGGSCYTVCAGGHVLGAGYGGLSREHGLISDHLYAVEVVVADENGVRAVTATREQGDPNRDLWWAHTGAGGGSFGIVTRYWFRSPQGGSTPKTALPAPPREVWVHRSQWAWKDMTQAGFTRLLRNYGSWLEDNSATGSPYTGLFSRLELTTVGSGAFHLVVQMDAGKPDAEALLNAFLAAVNAGVGVQATVTDHRRMPWLHASGWPGMWMSNPTDRYKYKSSFHRRGFTDAQISAFYEKLTATDYAQPPFVVSIASYGGRINTLAPGDTAHAHRDSVMLLLWGTAWQSSADDDLHLGWHQDFYRAVYADTGGVPVPNENTDGCFINYCDIDLSDGGLNTSGVAWHDLYYKENYARLQQVKQNWDPDDVFRHAQSIRLP